MKSFCFPSAHVLQAKNSETKLNKNNLEEREKKRQARDKMNNMVEQN